MARLSRNFYADGTVSVAQKLLGRYLIRRFQGTLLAGRIVETEAYIGRCDKACHAYRGRTARTEVMFGAPGHAYVYLIYGMHHCLNLVTEPEGDAAAVLLRAVDVCAGQDTAARLRFGKPFAALSPVQKRSLTNGPGKLCQGFAITRSDNGADLTGEELFVCDSLADVGLPVQPVPPEHLCIGPRVGVDYAEEARDFPWRFRLLPDNG